MDDVVIWQFENVPERTRTYPNVPNVSECIQLYGNLTPQNYTYSSNLTFNDCSYVNGGIIKIGNIVFIQLRVAPADNGVDLTITCPYTALLTSKAVVALSCYQSGGLRNPLNAFMGASGDIHVNDVVYESTREIIITGCCICN